MSRGRIIAAPAWLCAALLACCPQAAAEGTPPAGRSPIGAEGVERSVPRDAPGSGETADMPAATPTPARPEPAARSEAAASPAGRQGPRPAGTLARVVAAARAHDPSVAAAEAAVDAAEADRLRAWLAYVPQASVEASLSATPAYRGDLLTGYRDPSAWGPLAELEIVGGMPLVASGQLFALRAAARAGVARAEARWRAQRGDAAERAARAWWRWRAATRALHLLDAARQRAERIADHIDLLEDEDSPDLDPTDRLRLRLHTSALAVWQAEWDARRAQAWAELVAATGRDDWVADTGPLPEPPDALEEWPAWIRTARARRPELEATRATRRAASAAADLALTRLLPTVGVVGRMSASVAPHVTDQRGVFTPDGYNGLSGGAALGLRWPLKVGEGLGHLAAARAQARAATAWEQAQALRLLVSLRQAYEQVRVSRARWHARRVTHEAARQTACARMAALQRTPIADVLDAESERIEAALGEVAAARDAAVARIHLRRLAGLPLP